MSACAICNSLRLDLDDGALHSPGEEVDYVSGEDDDDSPCVPLASSVPPVLLHASPSPKITCTKKHS